MLCLKLPVAGLLPWADMKSNAIAARKTDIAITAVATAIALNARQANRPFGLKNSCSQRFQ